jgi:DDE superfamily endonuclease
MENKTLLSHWLEILSEWQNAFLQRRTLHRAIRLAFGSLCSLGRRTMSRAIAAIGRDQQDWAADYKLFSRSDWSLTMIFRPILEKSTLLIDEEIIAFAFDDTKLHKTGRHIESAFWQRDPMSPPFHVNLVWGLRFLQASILVPLYRNSDLSTPPRAIPIQFTEVPAVKKPGKYATEEEKLVYKSAKRQNNLSISFVENLKTLRTELDKQNLTNKMILATVDGSFCNKTCFNANIERTHIIARTRKDTALYYREQNRGRRFYGEKFTPEMVRLNETIEWSKTAIFHGGEWRDVRYKEVNNVYWKNGTKKKEIRTIIIAPTPYRLSKKKKLYYRQPAYLLTTDTKTDAAILIQKYFDRWQIEVNFREEKDLLGVGQAQIRSPKSVPRQPGFVVAAYSALLISSVLAYGDERKNCLIPLPKWRRNSRRPSILDLITQLRREAFENKWLKEVCDADFSIFDAALRAAA